MLRNKIIERELTLGTWIQLGNAGVAEILSDIGFEWIAVDCEHTDIGIEKLSEIITGINTKKAVPFVRVRENDTLAIRQVLDIGAEGIIVPLVNTAKDAEKAVAAAKFPPIGIRGFAYVRANGWGTRFDKYAKEANDKITVFIMIESKEAVKNIDTILSVEGVDGVFIGPYDMSGSYGVTGQTDHELVKEACGKVVEACKRHKKAAGIHLVRPDKSAIEEAAKAGMTFIALGMDTVFLQEFAEDIFRKASSIT